MKDNLFNATKIYKPEILVCPICNKPLKYCYTISNKVVQFSSGKTIRIKNLGYKCPSCNDTVFFSQTANKLAFKGYTYSAKTVCIIDYEKTVNHKGREAICDFLANKNIEISDRNIDIIHKKFNEIYNQDYDRAIKEAYANMMNKFNEIRISVDLITVNEICYILLYDFFTGDIIGLWKFNGMDDPSLKEILSRYINENYNITTIFSVRGYVSKLVPLIKALMPKKAKVYSFLKF
jgi:hypothetical protein